jgi:glycerol-3-phosphate dehydrogenase (NAD(P)+)
MKTVAMIGAGAWGTAVSTVLAHNGFQVNLWSHETTIAQIINKDHENTTFFPGVTLSEKIHATNCLKTALKDVDEIFFAVPVKYARSVLKDCELFYKKEQIWIFLNKGIEKETLLLPTQIAQGVLGDDICSSVVVGPSFAKDIVKQQMTGVVCAVKDDEIFKRVQPLLENNFIKLFQSHDIIGTQLCAAVKNVIALGVGMLSGQGYGDNSKIFFVMNALKEMEQIIQSCGGSPKTVFGFAGIGDIMLTALGKESRNLKVGKKLGEGQKLQTVLNEMNTVSEGVNTAYAIYELLQQKKIDAPLIKKVHQNLTKKVLFF